MARRVGSARLCASRVACNEREAADDGSSWSYVLESQNGRACQCPWSYARDPVGRAVDPQSCRFPSSKRATGQLRGVEVDKYRCKHELRPRSQLLVRLVSTV